MSLNFNQNKVAGSVGSNITSAPSTPGPGKGVQSLLSRASSITGSVTSTVQQIARATSQVAAVIKDRYKILLIIDDHLVDWSKYFRGRRLIGDWDIKVEQAEFNDISLTANSEMGAVVSIQTVDRNGYKIARTFRPDFVLVRQHTKDAGQNFSDIVVGLKYGIIPSINSLHSVYNFQDKTWVYANLLALQRKYGKDGFPLIEQTFYPSYKDSSGVPKLPCVVKIGASNSGMGKVKVDNLDQYQDVRSLLLTCDTYCTVEPYIEAKCDFHVQKIGTNYKVLSRKSVSGNWKANVGAAVLEALPLNDRYKKWIDGVSEAFGGLDICSLEGVIGKDGKEYILKARGSDLAILGDSQEEDRKNVVELIVQRMNIICKNQFIKQQSRASFSATEPDEPLPPPPPPGPGKRTSIPNSGQPNQPPVPPAPVPPAKPPPPAVTAMAPTIPNRQAPAAVGRPPPPPPTSAVPPPPAPTTGSASRPPPPKPPPPPSIPRPAAATTITTTIPATAKENPTTNPFNPFAADIESTNPSTTATTTTTVTAQQNPTTVDELKEEVDDTMRNLRKTFAGIFGDM